METKTARQGWQVAHFSMIKLAHFLLIKHSGTYYAVWRIACYGILHTCFASSGQSVSFAHMKLRWPFLSRRASFFSLRSLRSFEDTNKEPPSFRSEWRRFYSSVDERGKYCSMVLLTASTSCCSERGRPANKCWRSVRMVESPSRSEVSSSPTSIPSPLAMAQRVLNLGSSLPCSIL